MKLPVKSVEHNWEETSIYDADMNHICTFNIHSFGEVDEDNQEEYESHMAHLVAFVVNAINIKG